MRARFFTSTNKSLFSIDTNNFIDAVKKSDSSAIDEILEARNNGYSLDLNQEFHGETALEILLKKHDFENATKLINAGAKISIPYEVWVDDDGPYPYGSFETRHRNAFDKCKFSNEEVMHIINSLANDTSTVNRI